MSTNIIKNFAEIKKKLQIYKKNLEIPKNVFIFATQFSGYIIGEYMKSAEYNPIPDSLLHWEAIFKEGTHTDSEGVTLTFDSDKLNQMVTLYNEQTEDDKHVAPICLGHPEDNSPAYGWVERLKVLGNTLYAGFRDVKTEFVQWVRDGHYLKKSAAFYEDGLLRHVGFLGAMPPAVKGLPNASFTMPKVNGRLFCFSEEPKSDKSEFVITFADATVATPATTSTTPTNGTNPTDAALAELKQQQQSRKEKYGITPKDGIGYLSKSDAYKDLTDEQFADPVNYLYPIHDEANIYASFKAIRWSGGYNDIEEQIVYARLFGAALSLGISVLQDGIEFGEQAVKFAQKKRSDTYGISVVKDLGKKKPTIFSELKDEQFADPVHYRFPIGNNYVCGSLAAWNKKSSKAGYSESDRKVITSRLVRAARSYNINLTPYTWSYAECINQYAGLVKQKNFDRLRSELGKVFNPLKVASYKSKFADGDKPSPIVTIQADKLSNKQLLDIVGQLVGKDNNNPTQQINPQFEEVKMPYMTAEQFDTFAQDLITKVTEALQEETAGQISAFIEEMKADPKYWTREDGNGNPDDTTGAVAGDGTTATVGNGITANENNPYYKLYKEQQTQINALLEKDRLNGYAQYCESKEKEGVLLPKQRPVVIAALEAVKSISGVKYAEAGKVVTKDGESVIKALIESFPNQVEYQEHATAGRYSTGSGAAQSADGFVAPTLYRKHVDFAENDVNNSLYDEAQKLIAESTKSGKTLSFNEALTQARTKFNI